MEIEDLRNIYHSSVSKKCPECGEDIFVHPFPFYGGYWVHDKLLTDCKYNYHYIDLEEQKKLGISRRQKHPDLLDILLEREGTILLRKNND